MVVYISNSFVKVGVDEEKGGAICYMSHANNTQNVINCWDCGRCIQQSYYGRDDGTNWNGKSWCWNPVQAGSWNNLHARINSLVRVSDTRLVIHTTPRNWGGGELCEDVEMITDITLLPQGHVHMNCVMRYKGKEIHPVKDQEIPACFFDSSFSTLIYRTKNGNTIKTIPTEPSNNNMRTDADATWAGYMNPQTKQGVFVTCPRATQLTAYRVENTSQPHLSNCSYMAPLIVSAIAPESTVTYDVYFELVENAAF